MVPRNRIDGGSIIHLELEHFIEERIKRFSVNSRFLLPFPVGHEIDLQLKRLDSFGRALTGKLCV